MGVGKLFPTFAESLRWFDDTCMLYREFGAYDTEPRRVFRILIEETLRTGSPAPAPTTPEGWQLRGEIPGARQAAREMTKSAERATSAALRERDDAAGWLGT